MNAPTFTKSGAKAAAAVKLTPTIFDVPVEHHELLKAVYLAYWANGRVSLAKTKTRAMVRGGGRKPWKQKGTGRARFGSIRVPIWRGGGIALGPTGEENYTQKVNTKAKRTALRQALTLKAQAGNLIVLEDLALDGKTKSAVQLLDKIGANAGTTLVVTASKTTGDSRALSNLPMVELKAASYLNTANVLDAAKVVITTDALKALEQFLIPAKKPATDKGVTA